jgi:hypothetical protein
MNNKQRKTAALKFVNKIRKVLRKPPLKRLSLGIPEDRNGCPVALGIDDPSVDIDQETLTFINSPVKAYAVGVALGYTDDVENTSTALDLSAYPEVKKFLKDFDNFKYPELIDVRKWVKFRQEYV